MVQIPQDCSGLIPSEYGSSFPPDFNKSVERLYTVRNEQIMCRVSKTQLYLITTAANPCEKPQKNNL